MILKDILFATTLHFPSPKSVTGQTEVLTLSVLADTVGFYRTDTGTHTNMSQTWNL